MSTRKRSTRSRPADNYSKRGIDWEQRLDSIHHLYQKMGRAYVQRAGPPSKVTGKRDQRGRMYAVITAKGPPDYTIISRGRVFVADAKSVSGSRFGLDLVKDHQAGHLDAAQGQGALAGVILLVKAEACVSVLLWRDLGPLWWRWRRGQAKRGEASLTVDQVREMAVYVGTDCDYLDAVFG